MAEAALLAAAGVILLTVVVGLWRVLRGPSPADKLMAAQLLSTGGIAALLLVAHAYGLPAIIDVALLLALLGAFAAAAFGMAARVLGTR